MDEAPATKLLVIDSNHTVLEFVKKMCDQHSYEVTACSETTSAVSILMERKECFNLILIELDMPVMDGYEFLRFIDCEEINIPVIVMSADRRRTSIMKALDLGACDHWFKPLKENEFVNMWMHVFRKQIEEENKQKDIGSQKVDEKNKRDK